MKERQLRSTIASWCCSEVYLSQGGSTSLTVFSLLTCWKPSYLVLIILLTTGSFHMASFFYIFIFVTSMTLLLLFRSINVSWFPSKNVTQLYKILNFHKRKLKYHKAFVLRVRLLYMKQALKWSVLDLIEKRNIIFYVWFRSDLFLFF